MRMLLKVQMDTEASNKMAADGSMQKVMQAMFDQLKPEAAYFSPDDGHRSAYIVFDMQDPSQMPVIAEPLFQGLHAKVSFAPVMNLEDLQKGLGEVAKHH
jgi:hypothetical protein